MEIRLQFDSLKSDVYDNSDVSVVFANVTKPERRLTTKYLFSNTKKRFKYYALTLLDVDTWV